MINLSLIILSNNEGVSIEDGVEIILSNEANLVNNIKNAQGKYITFTKDSDMIDPNYLSIIKNKVLEDFDCCYINHVIDYEYKNNPKLNNNVTFLKNNLPYLGEYVWSFIFNKEKLITLLDCDLGEFNKKVDEIFENKTAIGEILIQHNPNGEKILNNFIYSDIKKEVTLKNVIYIGNGCNGTFNGYISWITNIGRCFGDEYDLTFMYDNITPHTLKRFEEKFTCVKREYDTNYICERVSSTYSDYYYPHNIIVIDENYLFIHGNCAEIPNSMKYKDDIYTKYIAVSDVAAKNAIGYYPSKQIGYIFNPFKLDENMVKPHLKIVSAQRFSKTKRPDRIEVVAKALDELEIPYTWNVFMDKYEGTNKNGLIYRKRVMNTLPYIKDADYFAIFSDSESYSYVAVEALSVNTKILSTPLPVFDKIGVKEGENAVFIPFEYFEEENKDKLKEILLKAYNEKEKEFEYKFDEKLSAGFHTIFLK